MDGTTAQVVYRRRNAQPPVFLAASNSTPPWTPREMEYTVAKDGSYSFAATIYTKPATTVFYKFRIGYGDRWTLDESAPTEIDDQGIRHNALRLEEGKSPRIESPPTPPPDSPPPRILDVDFTAIENVPLFSHEQLGGNADGLDGYAPMFAYELAGSRGSSRKERALSCATYRSDSQSSLFDFGEGFDPNDPTLERFPSSRKEVLRKVRSLSTGMTEDRPSFDGVPLSPIVSSVRSMSTDSNSDMLSMSPISIDTSAGRLDPQRTHKHRDSLGRLSSSAASLHCIVEEA